MDSQSDYLDTYKKDNLNTQLDHELKSSISQILVDLSNLEIFLETQHSDPDEEAILNPC